MAKKTVLSDLDSAKLEMVRIRFRMVMGEAVAPHVIKNARKNVAKMTRLAQANEGKDA